MATMDTPRLTKVLELLAHPHRRYALYYLTRNSKVIDIATLAEAIAKWENVRLGLGQRTDRIAVEVGLRHSHLPKLADAGIISYGSKRESIEYRDTDELNQFLVDTAPIDGYPLTASGD